MSKEPVNGSKTKNPLNDILNSVVKEPDGGSIRSLKVNFLDIHKDSSRMLFLKPFLFVYL